MAGIYIHIPFCKQACHYCDFHFSTSLALKRKVLDAMHQELQSRKSYLGNIAVESIYFGGGTPSILEVGEIEKLLRAIRHEFSITDNPEITLECNPDDVNTEKAQAWIQAGINRLSLGIQSFNEPFLKWMNRAHVAAEAEEAFYTLRMVGFQNISIDLIYGNPAPNHEAWQNDLAKALQLSPEHISAYSLTIEPNTAFGRWVKKKQMQSPEDDFAAEQYQLLVQELQKSGYEHYEVSNFAKAGFYSKHNASYWLQKPYIGLGPSAHSFNGHSRQWNVANNALYYKGVDAGSDYFEMETLSKEDRMNELLLTGLRTVWGVKVDDLINEFGISADWEGWEKIAVYKNKGWMLDDSERLILSSEGRLLADAITTELLF